MKIAITRYHDFSAGHRVVGHEGKCRNLHGHNYRAHFDVVSDRLDAVGRVVDFSVVRDRLCAWLEENWDHRMVLWDQDPDLAVIRAVDPTVAVVGFNPTAENLAQHLVFVVGPAQLAGTGCSLQGVTLEETRKCAASVTA